MDFRRTQSRRDDEERQNKVKRARGFIYKKGYVVGSSYVEDLLKETSLVPTEAWVFSSFYCCNF